MKLKKIKNFYSTEYRNKNNIVQKQYFCKNYVNNYIYILNVKNNRQNGIFIDINNETEKD